jgi:hypothetical protein
MPSRLTPAIGMVGGAGSGLGGLTPVPGSMYVQQTPTTLGQATGVGTVAPPHKRSKGIFIGAGIGVVLVAGIAIAAVAAGGGGGGSKDAPNGGSNGSATIAAVAPGSGSSTTTVVTPPTPGSATVPPAGSNATVPAAGSNTGSAAPTTGSAGSGAGSAEAGSAAPDAAMVMLTIETEPKGAKVLMNGFDIGKTSNVTMPIPRTKEKATIILQMHGYADEKVEIDPSTNDRTIAVSRTLRKITRVVTQGSGNAVPNKGGTTPGKGSSTGGGHTDTGTGLMKPGD